MKTLNLYAIRRAFTEDGRGWDMSNHVRYFTTKAKAVAALDKEIASHEKHGNWVEVRKNRYEAAFDKAWIVKEKIKIEA